MGQIPNNKEAKREISQTIAQLRRELNMTQEELAEALGMARPTIAAYEVGNRYPGPQSLKKLCDIFDVDMNFLTGNSPVRRSVAGAPPEINKVSESILVYDRRYFDEKRMTDPYRHIFDETQFLYAISLPRANMSYSSGAPHFAIVANESDCTGSSFREGDVCVFTPAERKEIRDGDVVCILYNGSVYIRKARYRTMSKEIEFFVSEEKDPITIKFSESYKVIVGRLDAVVSFRNK